MKYLIYGLGVPLILALLPISTHDYGRSGSTCWIKPDKNSISLTWRISCFFAPLWLVIFYNFIVYIKVITIYTIILLHKL